MGFAKLGRMGLVIIVLAVLISTSVQAATKDLGNGFFDHGVAAPISSLRGTVATVDGQGRNIVLSWLFDVRRTYEILLIDAETGKSEEYPVPFPPGDLFATLLSSRNKFYSHFNSHFVEFDPEKRAFTFHHKTAPGMAMGMTEDDNGVIWAVTYPDSGVVSFNPKTREFKDYGHVHKENWNQYQRYVATDDTGWLYFGIGNTKSHIIGLDPSTGKVKPMIPDNERVQAAGIVYRDVNGKVYGSPDYNEDNWYEFYEGKARKIGQRPEIQHKPIIAGCQGLFHTEFPDGKKLISCDLLERILTIEDPKTNTTKKLRFDCNSEGAYIMSVAVGPNGTICGGAQFPMRLFSYNPQTDQWFNENGYNQWNTVAKQGDRFYSGGYGHGTILEWDLTRQWAPIEKGNPNSNPLYLIDSSPTINRPHELLAHPDGRTLVLAGTPGYGYTGGGLRFWDCKTKKSTLLEHTDLLSEHSTHSLVALPDGKLLGGTTTAPGTGGEVKAKQAELYILDTTTKKIEWREPVLPGVQEYTDMCMGPDNLAYGIADHKHFFVFDPAQRKVIHQQDLYADFASRTNYQQGPRNFVTAPDGKVYLLLVKGITRVDPGTFKITMLAEAPMRIGAGGDYYKGRIYFARGSHLYSYKIPEKSVYKVSENSEPRP